MHFMEEPRLFSLNALTWTLELTIPVIMNEPVNETFLPLDWAITASFWYQGQERLSPLWSQSVHLKLDNTVKLKRNKTLLFQTKSSAHVGYLLEVCKLSYFYLFIYLPHPTQMSITLGQCITWPCHLACSGARGWTASCWWVFNVSYFTRAPNQMANSPFQHWRSKNSVCMVLLYPVIRCSHAVNSNEEFRWCNKHTLE